MTRSSWLGDISSVVALGYNELWRPVVANRLSVTSQSLWSLATTNCGSLWPQKASYMIATRDDLVTIPIELTPRTGQSPRTSSFIKQYTRADFKLRIQRLVDVCPVIMYYIYTWYTEVKSLFLHYWSVINPPLKLTLAKSCILRYKPKKLLLNDVGSREAGQG